jgi:4'-phosphopantetheinyl transferase
MESSIRLEFNLSHSYGFLVLAVTWGRQIGIDVERVRPIDDLDHLAAITFSEYEQNELSTFTSDKKLHGFFNCWTRKEAYVKAIGSGLLAPLDTFDMSLAPDNPICMLSNRLDPKEVSRWSFYTFVPEPGYVSALAVEGQGVIMQLKRWRVDL